MATPGFIRHARGILFHGLAWSAAFATLSALFLGALFLGGDLPEASSKGGPAGLVARFAIWGFLCGVFFASAAALAYRRRPLPDGGTVRFAIVGGLASAAFVPLFMQLLNVLSGGGLVPWRLVLDDAVWAAILGAAGAVLYLGLARKR